jgi:hypothetical protein
MFTWAGVVQNPVHTDTEQPYIYIALTDVTKGTLLYETFNFAGTSAVWHNVPASNPLVQYTDWQIIDIPCDSSMVTVGDTVKIEAVAAGCSLGGHWGYLYVDRFGSFYPVTPVITANDKPFDGTTAATIATRSLTGVRPGDDVSLTGGTATFDTAAVGTGKTVTASGLSLTGGDRRDRGRRRQRHVGRRRRGHRARRLLEHVSEPDGRQQPHHGRDRHRGLHELTHRTDREHDVPRPCLCD